MVSIPPYWPYVDPWEKLILIIKNRVKILERKGTEINFRDFKKIIYNLVIKEIEEWIAKSRTDSLSLVI